ncbi:MAG TPA: isoprenylcysteine carboxylmethyltransferase family protein [bacterium]|nr:isoprenylcysteine carboxylmethyltransferase family protein [bacterium]
MEQRSATAGAGLPAPVIFAGLFVIGLVLNALLPHVALPRGLRAAGWLLALFGFAVIGLPGILALRRAGTSPNPRRPTTALVQDGPYRYTRHPLYVSMATIYAGAALGVNSLWALVLLPAAVALIDRGPMVREERYMEQKFGEAYRTYKARVRRWV